MSTRERVELWDDQFGLSVLRWTPTGFVGAIAFLYAAYISPNAGLFEDGYSTRTTLVGSGVALLSMIPLTVIFIFPTVFKLKGLLNLEDKYWPSEQEVRRLIAKWDVRHWGRIACSFTCFALGVYDLCRLCLAQRCVIGK